MTKNLIFILVLIFMVADCASDLERHGKSLSGGRDVDLSEIYVEDIETGEDISIADYMLDQKINFMLLMFGSVGCTKCNEKALDLSQNYLGKHQLLLSSSEKKFELVGVNTDSGGARSRFNRIMLSPEQRTASGYDFIKWADPAGELFLKKILKPDERFGVPYTAFISKKGIEEKIQFSYNNQQPYSLEDLLQQALDVIEGRQGEGSGTGTEKPDPPKPPKVKFDLSFESSNRFDEIKLASCATGSPATLSELVKSADISFIQVTKSKCDADSHCFDNLTHLKDLSLLCTGSDSCKSITLSAANNLAEETCGLEGVFRGGAKFYETFETHFNWKYDPYIDEYGEPSSIKKVDGPLVFVFRKNGKLIYTHEGLLPRESQSNSLEKVLSAGANERAAIVDFPLYGESSYEQEPKNLSMSAILRQAKYTVIAGFGPTCSGCIEELEHWSEAGELAGFCKDSNGFCQVFALDENLPRPNTPQGRRARFDLVKDNFFRPSHVKVPLLLEQEVFSDYFGRLYQSYLSLYFKWQSYGTVLYDREGKIIYDFPGGKVYKPDPILKTLQTLKEKL